MSFEIKLILIVQKENIFHVNSNMPKTILIRHYFNTWPIYLYTNEYKLNYQTHKKQ
jgi:hypothetical protein